jgi:hypothetical protein
MYRLGDSHYVASPLRDEGHEGSTASGQLETYIKVCGNCGYVEQFSRVLIKRFEADIERARSFGRVTHQSQSGSTRVTLFPTPERPFAVQLSGETWLYLKLSLPDLPDKELFDIVFAAPYRDQWMALYGPFPKDFASLLRALLMSHVESNEG